MAMCLSSRCMIPNKWKELTTHELDSAGGGVVFDCMATVATRALTFPSGYD